MSEKKVYEAISAIGAELSQTGISKDRKNQQQGYAFRGIDDIYGAISALLPKHHIVIIPRFVTRTVTEKVSRQGGALFYVTVEGEFDIVCTVDGSSHTARMFGEAMDSADKATNKAMSAAYKYLALQLFCIPTEGDNDADATTHEVKASSPAPAPAPAPAPRPAATPAAPLPRAETRHEDQSELRSQSWYSVMVPIPRKGQKRGDYIVHPDTIGSLYDATQAGDQESQRRLWGFAHNFEPKGWTKTSGEKMPASKEDIEFRVALDDFLEWHNQQDKESDDVPF